MLHYWFTIGRILVSRRWQAPVAFNATIRRQFRVRLFDCDGLRVMTASKYPAYMDYIRWELIARSPMFPVMWRMGLAPTLGSQHIVYRKPLKLWTRYSVELELAGYDDKWFYHIHRFEQAGEVKAIGITRALIWKRDKPTAMDDLKREVGASAPMDPPTWVTALFENDKVLLTR